MINLPDDIQYLIWKSYFSHHILSNLPKHHFHRSINGITNKYTDEITTQWYRDDCKPYPYIYPNELKL